MNIFAARILIRMLHQKGEFVGRRGIPGGLSW